MTSAKRRSSSDETTVHRLLAFAFTALFVLNAGMSHTAEKPKGLAPLEAEPLPLGSIKPDGWLKRQLQIQANGLGGHLDEMWPDVKDSSWLGGKAEGWERGPYWLDGFLPLAILLDDPKLKERAQRWIDYVLKTQQADGWLGPLAGNPDPNSRLSQYDVWPRYIVLKAMTQWQEATGDTRIIPSMQKFFRRLDTLLDEKPLQEWARVRWADLVLSIHWLHDRTGEEWLLPLAAKVHKQGLDWIALGRDFPYKGKVTNDELQKFKTAAGGQWINDQFGATHGVNVSMGVKAPGVWSRQSQAEADFDAGLQLIKALDAYHGQATGVFAADEHLAGKHPSQGTELCAVVELMFSLENLLAVRPQAELGDRLESAAFNALPATFKDDMWAHQYDQQANQVVCRVSPERIYTNNGPDSNLYGFEPTFGCCLANMHQGWPKLISHLWTRNKAGGLTAMVYAPCIVTTKIAGQDVRVNVETDYPFRERVRITVTTPKAVKFPLQLRIPSWANGARVAVEGEQELAARQGSFHTIDRTWNGATKVVLSLPMGLRAERRFNESVSIYRGPLLFALEVGQDWRKIRRELPAADFEVHPTTSWNYAIALDPQAPEKTVRVAESAVAPSAFSPEAPAIRLFGKGRKLPNWRLVKNAADAPPKSPVESSEAIEEVRLVPYGGAKLRVTEIPLLAQ
jgi:uncharacterized protein